ncbi:MAG: glycosyltransferase [Chloroflexota bacterium]
MRVLCVSAQLPGHLDWGGYLKTAVALQEAGHSVLWASGRPVKELVEQVKIPFSSLEQTGWRWPPPPPLSTLDNNAPSHVYQRQRAERALDQWLNVERVQEATTELMALANTFSPDLVVAENFMSAGALVAEACHLPFAVAGWPALQVSATPENQLMVEAGRQRLALLLDRFSLHGTHWTLGGPPALLSSQLHLTYWSDSWYKGLDLLPQTRHVGGSAVPEDEHSPDPASRALLSNSEIAELPWVLVTLGTSFNDDANFFITASHAAEALGVIPIMALGRTPPQPFLNQLNAKAARSSILVDRLNFAQILPYVSAAIHHGGAGTTHALVTHAIPQIVVPHAGEQMHQVHGVTRSGVGVGIRPQNVTLDGLTQMLEGMLTEDAQFQQNAQLLQEEFAQLGGVTEAVRYLERIVEGA